MTNVISESKSKSAIMTRRQQMKPILFNTEMVRAILDGRKTVTRRLVKERTEYPLACRAVYNPVGLMTASGIIRPNYEIGDILYIRETWRYVYDLDEDERLIEESGRYIYYADNPNPFDTWIMPDGTKRYSMPWKPSIHMPKKAARIFLRVTGVRIERLQDIRYEDCLAEGVQLTFLQQRDLAKRGLIAWNRFSVVWDNTVKKFDLSKYGWNANPWVWVIEFERISKEEAHGRENRA